MFYSEVMTPPTPPPQSTQNIHLAFYKEPLEKSSGWVKKTEFKIYNNAQTCEKWGGLFLHINLIRVVSKHHCPLPAALRLPPAPPGGPPVLTQERHLLEGWASGRRTSGGWRNN